MNKLIRFILLCVGFVGYFTNSYAMIYHATQHQMTQPNGDTITVYLYGTELYIDAESADHYTLIKDEETGYICYALLSADGNHYASTGIVYKGGDAPAAVKMIVNPSIRISKEARNEKIAQTKKTLHFDEHPDISLRAATALPDTVYGVCCLIDFPDTQSKVSIEQIRTFLNADEETVFKNAMSIKKYFQWISSGKLTYINFVPSQFYTAPNSKEYYAPKDAQNYTVDKFLPVVEQALLSYTREKDGFDVKDLSTRNGAIMAINILYAGKCENQWGTGLWPHMNTHRFNLSSKGFSRWAWHGYQISDINDKLEMATFAHENGHLVCDWPDFYSYDGHEDNNAAIYNVADVTYLSATPPIPNPWALDQLGWLTNKIDITDWNEGRKVTLKQEVGSVAVYRGKGKNANEKYYIEIRDKHIATEKNRDKGIFIWHSNDKGDNTTEGNPELLDCRPATYHNPFWTATTGPSVFSDASDPSGKWATGDDSGIYLWDFSPYATTMTFRCGQKTREDKVEFLTTQLPDAMRGDYYQETIIAEGAEEPYHFEVVSGQLPLGLSLEIDGTLSGQLLRSNTDTFTIRATDSNGLSAEQTFIIHTNEKVAPYFDTLFTVPGTIPIEYFDRGGKGISYNSSSNAISSEPRDDYASVALVAHQELTNSYAIKLTEGDWMNYSILAKNEDDHYIASFSYATLRDATVDIFVDNEFFTTINLECSETIDPTKSYDYKRVQTPLSLSEGEHTLRLAVSQSPAELYLGSFFIDPPSNVQVADHRVANSTVYYNPTEHSYILYNIDNVDIILIYTIDGMVVDRFYPNASQITFGANYPAGIYIVKTIGGQENCSTKIIKQ